MAGYILRRVIQSLPIMVGIAVISFLIVYLAPGDPVERFRTGRVSPETLRNIIAIYGLDRPLPEQFFKWFTNFIQFWRTDSWAYSFIDGLPVQQKIFERIPATLLLMGTSLIVTIAVAIPIGILAAVKQYSVADKVITILATIGYAIPSFWLGLMLLYIFSIQLRIFPLFGMNSRGKEGDLLDIGWHLVLPVASLAIQQIAGWSRYMRSSMLEVLHHDYIRTARAKGLPQNRVIIKHALRNALIPILTLIGLTVPSLLAGAVITESIFSWPGLGFLGVTSVVNRDYPTVLAFTMLGGAMVLLGNLLADTLYAIVDPRIKY
ncbi:MAG: ABC transporter permease [Chloroflexi bacterium]|nr:ABC transporter permease [Chloroflexota bacterium]